MVSHQSVTYFILGEHLDHVLVFNLLHLVFFLFVCVCLSDWVVEDLLTLYKGISHFFIDRSFALEVGFLKHIVIHFLFPLAIAISQANLLSSFNCVHFV